ncbi:hypothetical protein B7R21_09665 [Subtercola boreus]|uniref:ABC3 transporter permease protein domain-containing protein n=1 Tax=Subtercola boreus TaxID=120213 RepID=A0A3E0VSJ5_9MICO|nr:hypothetical protein B7R21_09665 [Subtercola boreus]
MVTVIAVLSCTLLSALVLMVQNAGQVGVRASLAGLSEADSRISVNLDRPSVTLAEARAAVDGSVQAALNGAATSSRSAVAVSDFGAVTAFDSDLPAYAYFTAPDELGSVATLVSGAWPVPGAAGARTGHLDAAVPEQAAAQHGLAVGSSFAVRTGSTSSATADVVAIYRADTIADPAAGLWATDALQGAGDVRDFPRPDVTFFDPIEAIGPLLATPDALDAARVTVRSFALTYRLDFSNTDTSLLTGVSDRLADSDLTTAIGDSAAQVSVETGLPAALGQISTALTVTRSTVVIMAVLLTLLAIAAIAAIAALGQAARLFAASRVEDGVLARARGASACQLFSVASVEAALIGVLSAFAGPILAFLRDPRVWPSAPV